MQVRIGAYILFSNCDTGDVGLLMKIKIAVMSIRLRDGVMCFTVQIHLSHKVNDEDSLKSSESDRGVTQIGPTPRTKQEDSGQESLYERIYRIITFVDELPESGVMPHGTSQLLVPSFSACIHTSCKPYDLRKRTIENEQVSIPYFESDLRVTVLPFTPLTHGCCFCYNLKYRHNTTSTVYTIFANSRIFTLKISGFLAAIKLTDKSGYPDMQTLVVSLRWWCNLTWGPGKAGKRCLSYVKPLSGVIVFEQSLQRSSDTNSNHQPSSSSHTFNINNTTS